MIKNNIKFIRKQLGINKTELAARAKTAPSMISRLESGERKLTLEWIDTLHRALDCQPWELFPNEWQPAPGGVADIDRFLRILDSTNKTLDEINKAAPEDEKIRFVIYLYNQGYDAPTALTPANDNEIARAVRIAWRA